MDDYKNKCCDCVYCWKGSGEAFPSCKFEARGPDDVPPCEEDYNDLIFDGVFEDCGTIFEDFEDFDEFI